MALPYSLSVSKLQGLGVCISEMYIITFWNKTEVLTVYNTVWFPVASNFILCVVLLPESFETKTSRTKDYL